MCMKFVKCSVLYDFLDTLMLYILDVYFLIFFVVILNHLVLMKSAFVAFLFK